MIAALGLAIGAAWVFASIAIPVDDAGENFPSTTNKVLSVVIGVWGLLAGALTIRLAIRGLAVALGRDSGESLVRRGLVLAVTLLVWLCAWLLLSASEW